MTPKIDPEFKQLISLQAELETALSNMAKLHGVLHEHDDWGHGHLISQVEGVLLKLHVWSEKQRRGGISKDSGPCFVWSEEKGMHISTETRGKTVENEKREALVMVFEEVFRERQAMRYSDMKNELMTTLKMAENTSERIIGTASKLGVIKKSVACLWTRGA